MPALTKRTRIGTLVNRGGAGLLDKVKEHVSKVEVHQVDRTKAKKNNIQCEGTVVAISSLNLDPLNARLHPERNMNHIIDSLALYGQRIPLVVRKQGMVVAAGNGRLMGMKELGWTKCAVSIRPMTDIEFHGYALTDNKSALEAKWDFEAVALIDKMLLDAQQPIIGWTMDELEVLRAADWTPPAIEDGNLLGHDGLAVKFAAEQAEVIRNAIDLLKQQNPNENPLADAACLALICQQWVEASQE